MSCVFGTSSPETLVNSLNCCSKHSQNVSLSRVSHRIYDMVKLPTCFLNLMVVNKPILWIRNGLNKSEYSRIPSSSQTIFARVSEKCIISPRFRGENETYLKPPPRKPPWKKINLANMKHPADPIFVSTFSRQMSQFPPAKNFPQIQKTTNSSF